MLSLYHPKIKQLKAEIKSMFQEHLIWSFLAFMTGILLYFYHFPTILSIIILPLAVLGLILFYKKDFVFCFMLFITFVMLGCSICHLRYQMVAHPVLNQKLSNTIIVATITDNTVLPDKQILILNNISYPMGVIKQPDKIRLHYDNLEPLLKVGQRVKLKVNLVPPVSIKAPFHTSQAKRLYFEKIGAIGKVVQVLDIRDINAKPTIFQRLRHQITEHVFQILPENQARIITPLITGEQRLVSPELYQIYRRSGIVHVLSVSGFHMALLAGFLFFLIRGLGVVCGRLTLYVNTKKIAAVFALIGTGFYLALSGFQIPAVRSYLMIALVFLGILVNRKTFSVRTIILAGFCMLIFRPENLMSISFQLSFLSVLILVSVHEKFKQFMPNQNKYIRHFCEFCALGVAISLGLTPLIIWHFNQITPYGILGNLAFSFLFSLIIMPLLFIGCLLMPFEMDSALFQWAGTVIEWIEQMADWISKLPFAEISLPSFSVVGLSLIIFGIIFICLWQYWGKIMGVILILMGTLTAFNSDYPIMMVADKGQSIAYIQNGRFYANENGQDWIQTLWQNKLGFYRSEKIKDNIVEIKSKRIALSPDYCANADFAVLPIQSGHCRIDKLIPQGNKIYFIYIHKNRIEIETLSE